MQVRVSTASQAVREKGGLFPSVFSCDLAPCSPLAAAYLYRAALSCLTDRAQLSPPPVSPPAQVRSFPVCPPSCPLSQPCGAVAFGSITPLSGELTAGSRAAPPSSLCPQGLAQAPRRSIVTPSRSYCETERGDIRVGRRCQAPIFGLRSG